MVQSLIKPVTFSPNDGQRWALRKLLSWFEHPSDRYFRLIGPAGCGKTRTIVEFIEQVSQDGTYICLTSTTNQVVKMLGKMTENLDARIDCMTVHQLLGLQPRVTSETENQLIEVRANRIPFYDLIVIDECSRIDKALFKKILEKSKKHTKIVFLGDRFQLPPHKEYESEVFSPEFQVPTVELNEVMRFSGDYIGPVVDQLRDIDGPVLRFSQSRYNEDLSEGFWAVNSRVARGMIERGFRDGKQLKVLSWRNKTIDSINQQVRQSLFGKGIDEVVVGDRLITRSHVFVGNQISVANAEELQVHRVIDCIAPLMVGIEKIRFPSLLIEAETEDQRRVGLYKIRDAYKPQYEELVKSLRIKALKSRKKTDWKTFYEVNSTFADLAPAYGTTVHKSQGGTYENVIVMDWDIRLNRNARECNQCRYVAASRASKRLIFVQ